MFMSSAFIDHVHTSEADAWLFFNIMNMYFTSPKSVVQPDPTVTPFCAAGFKPAGNKKSMPGFARFHESLTRM